MFNIIHNKIYFRDISGTLIFHKKNRVLESLENFQRLDCKRPFSSFHNTFIQHGTRQIFLIQEKKIKNAREKRTSIVMHVSHFIDPSDDLIIQRTS